MSDAGHQDLPINVQEFAAHHPSRKGKQQPCEHTEEVSAFPWTQTQGFF